MESKSIGVLLVDVGTPGELSESSVRQYLNEFLGDPFVIRGPKWIREFLFKRLIIPLRAKKSLQKYRKIWTPKGSPIRVGAEDLAIKLQLELNRNRLEEKSPNPITWVVEFAFHYGGPALVNGLETLQKKGVTELIIVPLYPQWALSTRGSFEDQLRKLELYKGNSGKFGFSKISISGIFYKQEGFIKAQADLMLKHLPSLDPEETAVVFSFHGLPESHVKAVMPRCKKCLKLESECRPSKQVEPFCYRAQCFKTARSIANQCGLFYWDVAFQSRLGPMAWLEPSLKEVTDHLLEQGVETMVVQCPSFVLDGLETLEEVGTEIREYFLSRGGKNFILVPALNQSALWIEELKRMIFEQNGVLNENSETSP